MEHTTQLAHVAFWSQTFWVRGHPRHEEGWTLSRVGGSGRQHVKIIYKGHHIDIVHTGKALVFFFFFLSVRTETIFGLFVV